MTPPIDISPTYPPTAQRPYSFMIANHPAYGWGYHYQGLGFTAFLVGKPTQPPTDPELARRIEEFEENS
jgi:hypothetical protein